MPLLGICRGAQALNVARGGTLHQHLPGPPPERARLTATTHAVEVDARHAAGARSSGTGALASTPSTTRRSTRSAAGCSAVARAADGTIEAIEAPGRASCSASSGTPRA